MGRFRFQKPHLLLCSMTWLCVSKCVVTVDGGIVDCEGTVNIVHNFATSMCDKTVGSLDWETNQRNRDRLGLQRSPTVS